MRSLIVSLLLLITFNSFSQGLNFKEIDSSMYYHFSNENWKELVSIGEEANLDYYYFNIRIGIANYNLKRYLTAEKYLKKAVANNNNDFAQQFLFWNYLKLGENFLAEQAYNQLSEESKSKIKFNKPFIETIYLEGGLKSPNNQRVGKTTYGIFALEHRLGNNIRMIHSYSISSQKLPSETLSNRQYNFFGKYCFNSASIGLGTIIGSSELNESFPDSIKTPLGNTVPGNTSGTVSSSTNSFYINFAKRMNRLKFNANFNYVYQTINFDYLTKNGPPPDQGHGPMQPPPIEEKADSLINRKALIPSISLSYIPKLFNDRVSFGSELFLAITDKQTNVVLKPFLNISISDKLWLNTNYLQMKEILFADYSSGLLYNNLYLSEKRFSGTINYLFSPKITAKLTYTSEIFDDSYNEINYNTNSIFLGIQLKF